jgi:ribosomal-protein-serine acetyltransferase
MFSYPLKMDCYLALIEKRHYKKFFNFIEKNREYYRGILHFIDNLKNEKDSEAFILNSLGMMIEGKMVFWGIWSKEDIVGEVSIRDIDEEFKSAEIGYFVDKDFEGKGIVSQACKILINYVFKEFDIERLELGCDVKNIKSQHIADKLGFKIEGIARKGFVADGKLVDCSIYSLLKSEYKDIGLRNQENG